MTPPLDVIVHDGPCIVVNKPGGVLTQGPPGIDSMETRVRNYLRQLEQKDGRIYLGVPHRLDRPVPGVMVFTRHLRATQRLAAQFQKRTVKKKYWAVVEGEVQEPSGTWTDFMRKIPDRPKSEVVPSGTEGGQLAILDFVVRQQRGTQTWLEIELLTGRTHQIRVQAASRGFPILGDSLYGSDSAFGPQTADLRARWIALLARELQFRHPMEDRQLDVVAPIPDCWAELAGFEFDRDPLADG